MIKDRSIRLALVSKSFIGRNKTLKALDEVSLACEPGSFTALIGPSGCGSRRFCD
jgi:NitT/TauT family transport system ATP-binding protein